MQGGCAHLGFGIHVGAFGHQDFDEVLVWTRQRFMQRCSAMIGPEFASALGEKQHNDFVVSLPCGPMQRRPAVLVLLIHVGAIVQQLFHRGQIARLCSLVDFVAQSCTAKGKRPSRGNHCHQNDLRHHGSHCRSQIKIPRSLSGTLGLLPFLQLIIGSHL